MNMKERLIYLQELNRQKIELERRLVPIKADIEKKQESCSHIHVNLGCCGHDKYLCLICGKENKDDFFVPPYYTIHAENYLPQYDIKDEEQCILKFELIQTVALGLLKEHPDISRKELIVNLNNLIGENISITQEQSGIPLRKTKGKN